MAWTQAKVDAVHALNQAVAISQARGKFQGYIIGDNGFYATYAKDGVTHGYIDGNKSTVPDFIGGELELYKLAGAKLFTRGGF